MGGEGEDGGEGGARLVSDGGEGGGHDHHVWMAVVGKWLWRVASCMTYCCA